MDKFFSKTHTSLNISESVVETISQTVVNDIDGVYSLANLPSKNLVFITPSNAKAIKITLNSDVANIDVGVIIKLNYKIKDVCEQIQQTVKASVQNMTGIAVSKVNIFVLGVHIEDNKD